MIDAFHNIITGLSPDTLFFGAASIAFLVLLVLVLSIIVIARKVHKKEVELAALRRDVAFYERDRQALQRQLKEATDTLHQQSAEYNGTKQRLIAEKEALNEKLGTLENDLESRKQQFELLSNRILEKNTEQFNRSSKQTLDQVLTPLREQLTDFKKKVEDVYDKESKERVSLASELNQLKDLNLQMSKDAINLTNALKGDNKAQGNWGEVILERVLEESGLQKGREYETQVSVGHSRPDVIVRLPENKDIVIDSKVSLLHYERYCNEENDTDKQRALKDHINSVREHIKSLSFKNYEDLPGLRTLDFVFIFIPIESAFMTAFEHDQAMFRDAYEKNIIVVSPTTLLATLRTVQSIWRYERQNKNAEEIARQAGAMHDKFVNFVGDLENISTHIERAAKAQEDAMNKLSTGSGNLIGRTVKLEKLGAKAKKSLPSEQVRKAAEGEETDDADEPDDILLLTEESELEESES